MALAVRDGNSAAKTLKASVDGSDLVVHHNIDTVTNPVAVTQSGTWNISLISTMTPGTAAANLGKAEDAAHASGDTGVMALGVRRDAAASGAGTDGDYATLNLDANGRLYVNVSGGVTPGTGATDLGKAEDAAHTSADTGVMALAVRRDTAASGAGTDGDYATLNVDGSGRLHVALSGHLDADSRIVTNTVPTDYVGVVGQAASIVKRAFANIAASTTDGAVVAAVASKRIRVVSIAVFNQGGTGTTHTFNTKPGGAGSAISAARFTSGGGNYVMPFHPGGWFQTAVGEGLALTTGSGSTLGIDVTYIEV